MHGARFSRKSFAGESGLPFLALLAGNVALAFGPVFVRMATADAHIGPLAAAFWRLALAAPLLLVMTRVTRQPIGRLGPAMWATVALAGVLLARVLGTWHLGILKTKLANATLIGNSASMWFPLYGFLVARAWPTRGQALALVLAAVGAALMMARSYELSPQNLDGDLLSLLAGVLYTLYLIAIDRARGQLQPWPVLALSTIFGVLPLLLFARALGEPIWPDTWGPLITLALVSQLFGQGLLVYAMGHVRPLVTGLTFLIQPAIAAAAGWLWYGEELVAADWIGAALIGAAIVAVKRPATNLAPPAD
jgi:drug/metabolite transporter (DMT)-like permease